MFGRLEVGTFKNIFSSIDYTFFFHFGQVNIEIDFFFLFYLFDSFFIKYTSV